MKKLGGRNHLVHGQLPHSLPRPSRRTLVQVCWLRRTPRRHLHGGSALDTAVVPGGSLCSTLPVSSIYHSYRIDWLRRSATRLRICHHRLSLLFVLSDSMLLYLCWSIFINGKFSSASQPSLATSQDAFHANSATLHEEGCVHISLRLSHKEYFRLLAMCTTTTPHQGDQRRGNTHDANLGFTSRKIFKTRQPNRCLLCRIWC